MGIYKIVNESSDIYLNEGLFKSNHEPCNDFYEVAKNIIDEIDKTAKHFSYKLILGGAKTLQQSSSYTRSIIKQKEKIDKAKSKKKNSMTIVINISSIGGSKRSTDIMKEFGDIPEKFGFRLSKSRGNILADTFKGRYMFRLEKDGSFSTINIAVGYTTYNYVEVGVNDITISMKNMPDNEKTRKKINIKESGLNLEDSKDSIFSECNFI